MNWTHVDDRYDDSTPSHSASIQYSQNKPPTPTTTPRSANDGHPFWQTPRIEVEQKLDNLSQASGPAYEASPILWTTPINRRAEPGPPSAHPGGFEQRKINAELATHTHHLSPNPNLSLPPVEPSRQLSSSPGPGVLENGRHSSSATPRLEQRTPSSVSTIQTPPPSLTSQKQPLYIDTFRNIPVPMADPQRISNGSRPVMGPPETPSRLMQASPHMFPSLQFSPDLFQFQASGPASAPIYPQQRLFWDSSAGMSDESTPRPYQDPGSGLVGSFAHADMQHSFQPTGSIPADQPYDLPPSVRARPIQTSTTPYLDGPAFPAPFTTSPRVLPPQREDLSLFLSSPARRFGGAEQTTGAFKKPPGGEKPAYHHQIEESKRERELERARRAKVKRASGIFPLAASTRRASSPSHEVRPGLKRSVTHTGIAATQPPQRVQGHVSFADSIVGLNGQPGKTSRTGRTSPLKAVFTSPGSSYAAARPPAKQRTSLTFTIDEDGRAKTVVTKIPDPLDSFMDLDDESNESETDSVDESDFHLLHSQNNSFAFSEHDHLEHSVPHSSVKPRSHSKTSSYSSTNPSTNSGHLSSQTSSVNSTSKPRHGLADNLYGRHVANRSGHGGHVPRNPNRVNSDAMDEDDRPYNPAMTKGDAQHALRAIINERPRSTSTQDVGMADRRSISFTQFHSSPPVQHNVFATYNASPTTITDPDIATPSTDRESLVSNGSTRCVCSSSSPDGQFMIQCESCSKWLHMNCVGIDSKYIPEVYICIYCSQTPMRHGRLREPARPPTLTSASPLAHKSQRLR